MQSKVVKTITSQLAQSEYQYDSEGKDLYNSNCSTNHLRQGELPLTTMATFYLPTWRTGVFTCLTRTVTLFDTLQVAGH